MWGNGVARLAASAFVIAALPPLAVARPQGAGAVPAAAAPAVATMIVGRSQTLLAARTVTARAFTVGVRGRRCGVGAATPLAALAAARRGGGPAFAVRDYGACSRSPRDAASLFVYRVGSEANSGADGWVYKVDDRGGTSGAADPQGAFGDGRLLRRGDRVLWFWCHAGAGGGGSCQRTLAVAPATRKVGRGARLAVSVTGFDDHGHGKPIAGATVTLGGASATSGGNGVAVVAAPATAGRYAVAASAPGLVRSFPVEVRVG